MAAEPKIGELMPDGTIYAGISPRTGKWIFAAAADAPGRYSFRKAANYTKNLCAHGHRDFQVPSRSVLDVLWQNRTEGKLRGTFNETGAVPAGWYWSSTKGDFEHSVWV